LNFSGQCLRPRGILGWSVVHTFSFSFPLSADRSERSRGCLLPSGWVHSRRRRETRRAPIILRTGKEISTSLYLNAEGMDTRNFAKGGKKRDPFLRTRGNFDEKERERERGGGDAGKGSGIFLFYSLFFIATSFLSHRHFSIFITFIARSCTI